jgi:beta-lactamase class A
VKESFIHRSGTLCHERPSCPSICTVLRWVGGRLRAPRLALLLTGLVGLGGAAAWTATPQPAAGQVVDAAGYPVPAAVVTVPGTVLSPTARAVSDAAGRYRLGTVRWPFGPVQLAVRAPDFLPARTAGGRLVLHRWPRVAGRVLDDAGAVVPGAVVTFGLDGVVLQAAMADLEGRFDVAVRATSGTLTLTGFGDRHDAATGEVPLAVDRSAVVDLTLPRQFATVHVESDPAGQAPLVDGMPAPGCPATPCDVQVLAGAHQVGFGDDLFVPWLANVQVEKDATAAVSARLERKTGTLSIGVTAAGELSLDGTALDGSSWSGTVPTGRHTVGFRSAGTWPAVQQVDVAWNQTAQAALVPAAVAADPAGFAAGLRAYLAAQGGGTYGVYLEELGSGAVIGAGDTTAMEAASVIKVPEALYLLQQADAGQVVLDDEVDLHAEDFMGGTGSLYGRAHVGDRYRYRQLLALLIQQSDNTAWRALRRVLGDRAIDAYAASQGAGDCRQVTGSCTARSAGHLLAQLARGRLLSAGSTRLLLDLLETTIFNDRINWYLGRTPVAHKVGMDGAVRNDCGVVFLAADPFAICVFTTVDDVDQGVQVIRDIARAAYWMFSH